jgi:hypothetical protein
MERDGSPESKPNQLSAQWLFGDCLAIKADSLNEGFSRVEIVVDELNTAGSACFGHEPNGDSGLVVDEHYGSGPG